MSISDLIREKLVFEYLELQLYTRLLGIRHAQSSSAQSYAPAFDTEGKVFKATSGAAEKDFQKLLEVMIPWLNPKESVVDKLDKYNAEELMNKWEAKFGKLSDPEVQIKLKEYEQAISKNKSLKNEIPPEAEWVN